ncbi:MAG: Na+/H+ antiporter subunit B [Rubricoccaceae bacterium]
MNSLILRTASRLTLALLLLLSIFLLLRGHNEPGGGFIGGLVGAGAFALYGLAYGPAAIRTLLRVETSVLIGAGLASAALAGLLALTEGAPFLTAVWVTIPIGDGVKVGSPLLFDIGVYLVVVGFVLTFVLSLEENTLTAGPDAVPLPNMLVPPPGYVRQAPVPPAAAPEALASPEAPAPTR